MLLNDDDTHKMAVKGGGGGALVNCSARVPSLFAARSFSCGRLGRWTREAKVGAGRRNEGMNRQRGGGGERRELRLQLK